MESRILYHGSPTYVSGRITPSRAIDLKNRHPENNLLAVYASDNRALAISRAIEKGNFLKNLGKVKEPKYIFLYSLPSQTFEQSNIGTSQFFSFVPVVPLNVESIDVFDYLNLIGPNSWNHMVESPKSLFGKMLHGFAASPY
jgi:hypothetical protein